MILHPLARIAVRQHFGLPAETVLFGYGFDVQLNRYS